ncbi:glycoside hydrolase family 6 protein [Streptomyces sp. CHA1]|uniref:glycoside hydrolase family 6 protein n=1 Tax=Streptomyces TaxID=1883 RepID=UPI00053E9EF0|nr:MULTISPECIES: glycoside hydrolase family 6 protein [unclassified Streptomyces]MCO6707385.1 glycoside hydrolase family 6 protein [Streptomyces sp. CHA3]MCO6713122.1 glycoside hydrolase family 6 protein [Streptomyces sp. CHB19.2]MCO6719451.1 glycoside hydrolase family 6 protein [Streptomyces sp. Vc714c-19]MCO6726039.1 glycoside hydrolase family 6 protein [Streptomyces sp. CHA16]MCO6731106.1 glycoside hydrolase family 6 protein [Streptomyces sp. EL9]
MSTRSRGKRPSGGAGHRRRARSAAALTALFLGASLAVAVPGSASADAEDVTAARVDNPYVGATPYVNPDWSARAAAEPGGSAIADEPSFVWMDRIAAIEGTSSARGLEEHLDTALDQGADLFQVVIYDLPGRDCSALASNGELGPTEIGRYKSEYIDPIAELLADPAYADLRIVALIEPDSLPNLVTNAGGTAGSTPECAVMKENGNYEKGVGYALSTLGAIPNVYNYVDAAHHGWLGWDTNFVPAAQQFKKAATTEGATVDDVHGFIVNTANYSVLKEPYLKITDTVNGTTVRQSKWLDWNYYVDELTFAQGLREELVRQGFDSGLGMLIDTARNGWGGDDRPTGPGPTTSVDAFVDGGRADRRIHAGNWCNQSGAGVGERPVTAPEPGIDAYVWAKPPGESDGSSEPIDNDEGKGFDRMCDPTYEGNGRNGFSLTGALPDSPVAGHWFSAQFQELLANAHPPLDGGGGPGGPGEDDTTAPTAPTGLKTTATSATTVSLAWTAATDDTGVTGYDVYRDGTRIGSTTTTAYADSGLTSGTAYTYTVRAKDAAGNVSPPSASLAATTDEGGGSTGALKVQYRTSDTSPTDSQIRMGLQVVNTGQSAVNLADVKLRYWFTPDGSSAVNSTCDWAQLGCGRVTHTVEQASGSAPGASHYVEVGFASGSLAPGAATGEIQLRLNKADWSTFDESDDYSRSTSTGFTDHAKIGLYLGTALTWGTAP